MKLYRYYCIILGITLLANSEIFSAATIKSATAKKKLAREIGLELINEVYKLMDAVTSEPKKDRIKKNVKKFIKLGSEVNITDDSGNTALMVACSYSHKDIVKLLLNAGAKVDLSNKYGITALENAVSTQYANKDIIEILLASGADVNAVNSGGYTVLMRAIDDREIIEILLRAGANMSASVYPDGTALTQAISCGYKVKVEILLKAGASDKSSSDYVGKAPINREEIRKIVHEESARRKSAIIKWEKLHMILKELSKIRSETNLIPPLEILIEEYAFENLCYEMLPLDFRLSS